jgi:hypothetical protein
LGREKGVDCAPRYTRRRHGREGERREGGCAPVQGVPSRGEVKEESGLCAAFQGTTSRSGWGEKEIGLCVAFQEATSRSGEGRAEIGLCAALTGWRHVRRETEWAVRRVARSDDTWGKN